MGLRCTFKLNGQGANYPTMREHFREALQGSGSYPLYVDNPMAFEVSVMGMCDGKSLPYSMTIRMTRDARGAVTEDVVRADLETVAASYGKTVSDLKIENVPGL